MWYVLLIEKNVLKTYLGLSSSKSFRGSDFEHWGVSSDSGLTSFKSLFISNTVLVVLLMFSLSSGIQALLLFILSHVFTSRLLSFKNKITLKWSRFEICKPHCKIKPIFVFIVSSVAMKTKVTRQTQYKSSSNTHPLGQIESVECFLKEILCLLVWCV